MTLTQRQENCVYHLSDGCRWCRYFPSLVRNPSQMNDAKIYETRYRFPLIYIITRVRRDTAILPCVRPSDLCRQHRSQLVPLPPTVLGDFDPL